ncbi:hypothetical protein [Actinoalloteichus hymeniacidonis]|uniref:Uncharacterized protein n=1 Tax=Actinoalloteichus hymeniacidonis TaxID=340345 RepID=A0AAC9HUG0_9PSEU|nr:hypothetical protein [Actinoalloteichus hymeniacidonis]AOS65151.1 hypothetical protein TL08_21820 [Actinoalloteichus hymeniacidonis]MBB5906770.1 hypothetical protein [Actinoalloteichus hymeniacidonis]
MAYHWRYQDEVGREVPGPEISFAEQTAAERWFETQWSELTDAGVQQVTLVHNGADVYGPMSLSPEA